MPVTIPDYNFEETKPKKVEIPDFDFKESPPVQAAAAAGVSPPTVVPSTPAPVEALAAPQAKAIPDFVFSDEAGAPPTTAPPVDGIMQRVSSLIPDFSANGDKNPVEGFYDAMKLYYTGIGTGIVKGLSEAGQYAIRGAQHPAGAEELGSPSLQAIEGLNQLVRTMAGPENLQKAQGALDTLSNKMTDVADAATGPNPSLLRESVASAGQSVGFAIPALATAPFGGTPAVLATMGFLTAADTEKRALDEGVPYQKAKLAGQIDGLVEAGTELIPMKYLLKSAQPFLGKLAGLIVREIPSEMLATTLQDINDKINIHPDMTAGEFRDSLMHDLVVTAMSVPLSAGFQAGAVHLTQKAGEKLEALKKYTTGPGGILERKQPNDGGIHIEELLAEIERQLQMPELGQEVIKTNAKTPSEYLSQAPAALYKHFDTRELAANMQGMDAATAVQNLKDYAAEVKQTPEAEQELAGLIAGITRAEKGGQTIQPIVNYPVYHGTPRSFQEMKKTKPVEMGFHFANDASTAETRAKAKGASTKSRIIQAYLLLDNPLITPDVGTFSPIAISHFISQKFGKENTDAYYLQSRVVEAGQKAYNAEAVNKDWAQYNAQNSLVVKWMEENGYDGFKYKNQAEMPHASFDESNLPPAGKWSYAALRPEQIVQIGETENFDKMTSEHVTNLHAQKKQSLETVKNAVGEMVHVDPTKAADATVEKVLKGINTDKIQPGPIPYNVLGGISKLTPKNIEQIAQPQQQAAAKAAGPNELKQEMQLGISDNPEDMLADMEYVEQALDWEAQHDGNTWIENTNKGTVKLNHISGTMLNVTDVNGNTGPVEAHWLLGGKSIKIKSWDQGYGPYAGKYGTTKKIEKAPVKASIKVEPGFKEELFKEIGVQSSQPKGPAEQFYDEGPDAPTGIIQSESRQSPAAAPPKNYAQSGEDDLEWRRRQTQRDTFNKFIKWTAGLEHLAKMNKHISGLQRYLAATRDWWRTKSAWTVRANELLRAEWRAAVRSKETSHFDSFMVEADLRSTAKGDLLTGAELAQIVKDKGLKLSSKATNFAERVWSEYRAVLDAVEAQVIDEAVRTVPDPVRQANIIAKYRQQFDEMRRRNYMPHSRFGKYAILVKATANGVMFDGNRFNTGDTVLFATFESKGMRNKALENATKMFSPKETTIRGDYVIDDVVQMFQGLPEPVAQMIAARMNLTQVQKQQLSELQHELSPGARFAKHFQAREGVPGYSPDTRRVFADYFLRFSNHIARITHNFELQGALKEVSDSIRQDFVFGEDATKRRQMQEWLQEHYDYLNNPGNELANLRSLGFLYYLGFNPKSAIVNLTQVPLVAYPHLAAKYGDVQAIASLSSAMAKVGNVFRGKARYSALEQGMLDELVRRGILDQSSATELGAVSEGSQLQRLTAGRFVGNERVAAGIRQLAEWGSWMFQAAEKLNRRVVGLSAYDLAVKSGMNHLQAIDAAHEAIIDTQYEYARYNRPQLMRGKKSALFLFWQYMSNTLYFIGNDPGRWRYLAMVLAAAGFSGLPGADNAMDLFDYFATKIKEKTGWKDPKVSSRVELRNLMQIINEMPYVDWFIPDNPNVAMHGLSSNLGGFDISGSLSMGRLLPGTEALSTETDPDKAVSQSLQNVSGALGSIVFSLYHALGSDEPGTWRQYERVMPSVVRGASRAARYATEGKETDTGGATVVKFDPTNWNDRILIAGQALGFPLTKVNTEREKNFLSRDVVNYYSARRGTLFAEYAWALQQGGEEVAAARKAITDYNEVVPHPGLRITGDDLVRSVTQRQRQKARKEADAPVANREIPYYRKIQERFEPSQGPPGSGGYQP